MNGAGRLCVLLLVLWQGASAAELRVDAGLSRLEFAPGGVTPERWTVCERPCADATARRAVVYARGDGGLRLSGTGAATAPPEVVPLAGYTEVSVPTGGGSVLYRLYDNSAAIELILPPGAALRLESGDSFVPEPLPGFGGIYSRVKPVAVTTDGQQVIEPGDDSATQSVSAAAGDWSGVRSRYWALLAQPPTGTVASVRMLAENRPQLVYASANEVVRMRLYAGPIEAQALREADPRLSKLLFAALWDVLRWLTFGMMLLYNGILALTGSPGVAVVLLSLAVKVLMYPLTALADRWQAEVNATHSLLQPEITAIRRAYKGEEAHRKVLAVYEQHNVSQFYTFRSAAGFLIQIPVFIAAFDMLAENFALNGAGFLWMTNLAEPDRLLALPVALPFFGAHLNLLPFIMTFLSSLAAWLQAEDSLTPELQRQQSIRLYLMSAAFFVLFYTFPAGMVLYWTASNLFHLLKVESGRLVSRSRA